MKIFDYEIKNIPLAIIGFGVFSLVLIIPEKYGMATRIFSAVVGFILVGLSTDNKKFKAEVKALVIIVIIA